MDVHDGCYNFHIPERIKQKRPAYAVQPYVDSGLCIVTTLKKYFNRTSCPRGSKDQLLINHSKPFKKVSRDTIGRGTKYVLLKAGVDTLKFTLSPIVQELQVLQQQTLHSLWKT